MKKASLIILVSVFSLVSQASLDCEDVIYMSTESAQLNRLAAGLPHQADPEQVLEITKQIAAEVQESVAIAPEIPVSPEYNQYLFVQSQLSKLESGEYSPTQVTSNIKPHNLTMTNELRVQMMEQLRKQYPHCFNIPKAK